MCEIFHVVVYVALLCIYAVCRYCIHSVSYIVYMLTFWVSDMFVIFINVCFL